MSPKSSDYHVTSAHAIWLKLRAIQLLNSTLTQALSSNLESVIYSVMCLLLISVRSVPFTIDAYRRIDPGRLRRMMRSRSEHTQTLCGSFSKTTRTQRAYQIMYLQWWCRKFKPVCGTWPQTDQLASTGYVSSSIVKISPSCPPLEESPSAEISQLIARALHQDPNLTKVGVGFFANPVVGILNVTLRAAVKEMRQTIILREYLRCGRERPSHYQSSYFHSKCMKGHFLVLTGEIVLEGHIGWLREACRLALLIFWNANTRLHGHNSILYHRLAANLKAALLATDSDRLDDQYWLLLIWIGFLGAFISRHDLDRPWFVTMISRLAGARPSISWNELSVELVQLLYLENIYGQGFKQIWDDAKSVSVTGVGSVIS